MINVIDGISIVTSKIRKGTLVAGRATMPSGKMGTVFVLVGPPDEPARELVLPHTR